MTEAVAQVLKKTYQDLRPMYTNAPEEALLGLITPFDHAKAMTIAIRRAAMIEHNALEEQGNTKQILGVVWAHGQLRFACRERRCQTYKSWQWQ